MSHKTFVAAGLETSFVTLPRRLVTFGHRVEFLSDSDSLVLGQGQQRTESNTMLLQSGASSNSARDWWLDRVPIRKPSLLNYTK